MPALTTVLIVEDDASLRETVQLYIEREEIALSEARIMAWMASLKFNATARFSRVGYHAA